MDPAQDSSAGRAALQTGRADASGASAADLAAARRSVNAALVGGLSRSAAPTPAQAAIRQRARATPVLQRMWNLEWTALTAEQKTERGALAPNQKAYPSLKKSQLNAPLRAALTLAQAHPSKAPPLPAWLSTEVKLDDGAGGFVFRPSPGKRGAGTYPTRPRYLKEHKEQYQKQWASPHMNFAGLLPGTRGAGGYLEYYAEPSPNAAQAAYDGQQRFGSNRILQQQNATGSHDYWWATGDHYASFSFISDATTLKPAAKAAAKAAPAAAKAPLKSAWGAPPGKTAVPVGAGKP
jgi:hypothetical protein